MSLAPRKLPRQQRSKATVDTILEATVRVLLARGYQGTTTIAVAERAGVSVGSLYQYFPNKDSLIAALLKGHLANVVRGLDEALQACAGRDLEGALRQIVRAGITVHRIHPALHKILVEQVPRIGQMKSMMNTSRVVTRRLAEWFEAQRGLGIAHPERAAFMVETVVEGLTHRVIIEKAHNFSDRELEDEATRLLVAYLAPR
jgi:AcrR family transcriptional regulator